MGAIMRFYSVLKSREGKPIDFKKIEKNVKEICKKFEISLFYIYGSYVKGNPWKMSDIDLAYLSEKNFSWEEESKLIEYLEENFEDEAIDLVNLKNAPLTLIHRVLKEGRCLYASDLKTKIDFETRKESEYFETEWMRKEYFERMIKKIENGSIWD